MVGERNHRRLVLINNISALRSVNSSESFRGGGWKRRVEPPQMGGDPRGDYTGSPNGRWDTIIDVHSIFSSGTVYMVMYTYDTTVASALI